MIRKIIHRIKLHFNPPRPGDVYYADSFLFMVPGLTMEKILHRTSSVSGDALWEPIFGPDAYRLTIESDTMPYYKCKGELLAQNAAGYGKEWLPRQTHRRYWKKDFIQMILDGEIKKRELI